MSEGSETNDHGCLLGAAGGKSIQQNLGADDRRAMRNQSKHLLLLFSGYSCSGGRNFEREDRYAYCQTLPGGLTGGVPVPSGEFLHEKPKGGHAPLSLPAPGGIYPSSGSAPLSADLPVYRKHHLCPQAGGGKQGADHPFFQVPPAGVRSGLAGTWDGL